MPYTGPSGSSSSMSSPAKNTSAPATPVSKKGFYTPPTHVEDIGQSSSGISGPMPGIPRRASNRGDSPAMSRSASSGLPSLIRPADGGLPRRSSHTPSSSVSGLPQHVGTLGLKLHPSPTGATMVRGPKDSLDSTSTIESSLPPTPRDDPLELDMEPTPKIEKDSIPFPVTPPRPSLSPNHPIRASMSQSSPQRPAMSRNHSGPTHTRGSGSLQVQIPESASTSRLGGSPGRPTRPTSMIRKKSGEVVKPSLKQRSMSTPDLTRLPEEAHEEEESASRPFGQERSKSVRFADADESSGSVLDNVVHFLVNSKPINVAKPINLDGQQTETETEAETDVASDFVLFRTRRNLGAADDPKDLALQGGSRVPRVRCDFSPDARHALDGEMVVMERAELKVANGALCLQGTAIVRNVAFQKWVAVRFTMDHWQTTSEVSGAHVTHIPSSTSGDEGWDRFSFSVKLEDYRRKLEERQLMLCIRYSIEGQEWWDSNNGMNYQFNFRRLVARKTRNSLPPTFPKPTAEYAAAASIPGLRQAGNGGFVPSSRIAQQFGAGTPKPASTGPRTWHFPTSGPVVTSPSGADSPALSPPPAAAYQPPSLPDVHTHLSLSRYCAPSPPQSPPGSSSELASTASTSTHVNAIAGSGTNPAPPQASALASSHERRSSWAGNADSWDSFGKVMEDAGEGSSSTGDSTPTATESHLPAAGSSSSVNSPPHKPLTMKRSTGDLQALRQGGAGLTPPSSHSSSPSPSSHTVPLPVIEGEPPMSPTVSSLSTGESSPIATSTTDSTSDLAGMDVTNQTINQASYDELIARFCFYQPPRDTPTADDLHPTRRDYVHVSGSASPVGFPFFSGSGGGSGSGSGSRPRPNFGNENLTPRAEYNSASDAFNIPGPSSTPRAMSRQNSHGIPGPPSAGPSGTPRAVGAN